MPADQNRQDQPRPVGDAFTECRLAGVGSVVTMTVAPLLAQIPLLAVVIHAGWPRRARSHRSGTSSITQPSWTIAA